jgi:hypothetical protein
VCQIVDFCDWTDHPANRDLICAARNALPNLIAEIRELRADRERLLHALSLIMPDPMDWPGYENADGEEIGTRVLDAINPARVHATRTDAESEQGGAE